MATEVKGRYREQIAEIKISLGGQAQNKTERALKNLTESGQIIGYNKSKWLSIDDIKGIDFYSYPLSGGEILIQVKTHYEPGEKQKYIKKGIQPIEVGRKQIEEIEKEILGLEIEKKKMFR